MFWKNKEVEILKKKVAELEDTVNKLTWWVLNDHYNTIKYYPDPDDSKRVIPVRNEASLETLFSLERHARNLGMKKGNSGSEGIEPTTED